MVAAAVAVSVGAAGAEVAAESVADVPRLPASEKPGSRWSASP